MPQSALRQRPCAVVASRGKAFAFASGTIRYGALTLSSYNASAQYLEWMDALSIFFAKIRPLPGGVSAPADQRAASGPRSYRPSNTLHAYANCTPLA